MLERIRGFIYTYILRPSLLLYIAGHNTLTSKKYNLLRPLNTVAKDLFPVANNIYDWICNCILQSLKLRLLIIFATRFTVAKFATALRLLCSCKVCNCFATRNFARAILLQSGCKILQKYLKILFAYAFPLQSGCKFLKKLFAFAFSIAKWLQIF